MLLVQDQAYELMIEAHAPQLASKAWRWGFGQPSEILLSDICEWVEAARRCGAALGDRVRISLEFTEVDNTPTTHVVLGGGDSDLAAMLRHDEIVRAFAYSDERAEVMQGWIVAGAVYALS